MKLGFLYLLILTTACTTTQQVRTLSITPEWSRSTLSKEYAGTKLFQDMTPVINGDYIYEGNGYDGFSAYNKKKGTLLWKRLFKNGASSGAVVSGDKVFFGSSDGQFNALNKLTGDFIWTFPTQTETLSAPIVEGERVYFLTSNGILNSLDTSSGKVIWSYSRREKTLFTIRVGSTPVIDGNIIYVGFSDGYFVALSKIDGSLKWEKQLNTDPRFRDVNGSPVISGSNIYVSSYDGALYCLDKSSGKTIWSFENGGYAPVTIHDNRIYYTSTNGFIFALDKATGKEIWSYKTKNGIGTQPEYYKGLIVFGESAGPLIVLQALDGKFVTKFTTGWGISAKPIVDSELNRIFVMSNYGNLYSLNFRWLSNGPGPFEF